MKALSIRQPWAWAIVHAGKDIENRSWPTRLRGQFLVHAAKGVTRDEYDEAADFIHGVLNPGPGAFSLSVPHFGELKRGGIIGSVELVHCVSSHWSPWFCGPHGFVLANPEPLPFRRMQGKLGFFEAME